MRTEGGRGFTGVPGFKPDRGNCSVFLNLPLTVIRMIFGASRVDSIDLRLIYVTGYTTKKLRASG